MFKKAAFIISMLISSHVFADKFIAVENNADLLSFYNIDKTSGVLTKIGHTYSLGHEPITGLISPDNSSLFVLNGSSMNISRFSLADIKNNKFDSGSIVGQIGVGTLTGSFTPDGSRLLVPAPAQNKLHYFSYNKTNQSITKSKEIDLKYCNGGFTMAFVPNTNVMYLSCYNSNTIEKLSYSSSTDSYLEEKTIVLGNGFGTKPRGIMFDSTNKKAYISSEGTGAIYVHNYTPSTGEIGSVITQINTNFTLLVSTSFDLYGNMIAVDRNTGTLNYYKKNSDGIYNSLVRSCHLGKLTLSSVQFDSNNHMYAITRGDNSISLYNTSADKCPQLVQNLTTTGMPFALIRVAE